MRRQLRFQRAEMAIPGVAQDDTIIALATRVLDGEQPRGYLEELYAVIRASVVVGAQEERPSHHRHAVRHRASALQPGTDGDGAARPSEGQILNPAPLLFFTR